MRNIFYIAIALIVTSCAKEEKQEQAEQQQITLTATFEQKAEANNAATKATATAFESGDELGLFVTKSGQDIQRTNNLVNNARMLVANDGTIKGDPTAVYYPSKTTLNLYSYYPYQSGDATADALGVQVGIRTDQTDFSAIKRSDLCFGFSDNVEPSNSAKAITFSHKFAQVRINITTYVGCAAVKQVRLINIKDSATLNIQTGAITLKPHLAEVRTNKSAENSFLAIIPAQQLNNACIAIDLEDDKTFIYNATTPINLKQSATNTLNLTLNDKHIVTLNGAPSISNWNTASSTGSVGQEVNNLITLRWLAPHADYATADRIIVTLVDLLNVTREVESTLTLDPKSSAQYAVFTFPLTIKGAGYPMVVTKTRIYKGATLLRESPQAAILGATLARAGAHTIGLNLAIDISPADDWVNVANTAQSRTITVTTAGTNQWTATATGVGLSVSPTSGTSGQTATISWAAQAVGALARNGSATFTTVPAGVTSIVATNQLAGPAPTLSLSATSPGVTIPAAGASYTITVTSNTAWSATASNATLDKSAGAAGATTIKITVAATAVATARTVTINFTTNAVPSKAVATAKWEGSQAAPTLTLNPAGNWTNVANTAQSRAIAVTTAGSNSWSAQATGTGLTVSPTSGTSGQSTTVSWAAQAVGALARSGSVKFTSGVVAPITIATNQVAGPAPTLALSATSPGVTVPNKGGTYSITVTGNVTWTASNLTNVTLDKTTGATGATTVKITVPSTNLTSTRTASVKFTTSSVPSGATATQTWSGTQAAAPANAVLINGLWWSTMNVGATSPQAYGGYYYFSDAPCPSGWRIPTVAEFTTLFSYPGNQTAWGNTPTAQWATLSGMTGAWAGPGAKSANPATAIFFPATGRRKQDGSYDNQGVIGWYWTSNAVDDINARSLYLSSTVLNIGQDWRTTRFNVRCVQ